MLYNMKTIAEIHDGRVRHIFKIRDNAPMPVYSNGIIAVDITSEVQTPQAWWRYEGGIFIEDVRPPRPRIPRYVNKNHITPAQKISLKTGTAAEKWAAMLEILGVE